MHDEIDMKRYPSWQEAEAHGYRLHEGGTDDGDLVGRWWWTRCREGWSDVEVGPDYATEASARASARRALAREIAAGDVGL